MSTDFSFIQKKINIKVIHVKKPHLQTKFSFFFFDFSSGSCSVLQLLLLLKKNKMKKI